MTLLLTLRDFNFSLVHEAFREAAISHVLERVAQTAQK